LGASIFQIDCPHLIDSIDEHQRMRRVYRNPKWAMKFVPLTFTELIMALLLVSGQAVAQEPIREKTESVPEQKASSPTSSDATVQAAATGPTTSGMILVSKRPVELLASPSSSASGIYGFPAGPRFRVIGQEAGFAHLQDVKSGATGWIDETALWQSPSVPTASVEPKPKAHAPGISM
jgi:hypothetical protein